MDGRASRAFSSVEKTFSEGDHAAAEPPGDAKNVHQTQSSEHSGTDAMSEDSGNGPEDRGVTISAAEPVNLATPELIDLQRALVEIGLMTTNQWSQAVSTVGKSADLPTFLNHLTKVESTRPLPTEERTPVLTKYQAKALLDGNARKLWFQHYLILDCLGKGGMGEVLKALNTNLYRIEAVKMIKPQSNTGPLETASRRRFKREAEILAQLDHPYITKVWNAGFQDELAFIAMEYVRGKDMEAIVREHRAANKPIPINWAIEKIIMVAEALEHAHQRRVLHRDIKPSNIMITDDRVGLKVLDLGIGRLLSDDRDAADSNPTLTQHGGPLGTPAFMPPEQWYDATQVTAASDIYSLGITLFYIITGQLPFKGRNVMFQHINDPPPRLRKFRPDAPKQLEAIVRKMLAKNKEDRYASAKEFIDALRPLLKSDEPDWKFPWKQVGYGVGAAAIVLSVLGGGTYLAPVVYRVVQPLFVDQVSLEIERLTPKIENPSTFEPKDLLRRANLYWQKDDIASAIADYEKAFAYNLQPADASEGHFQCGLAYLETDDPEKALNHFLAAVETPRADAYVEIAKIYLAQGDFAESMRAAAQALEASPSPELKTQATELSQQSRTKWILERIEDKDYINAVAEFDKGQLPEDETLHAAVAKALYAMGMQFYEQKDLNEAKVSLERSLALVPSAPVAVAAGNVAFDLEQFDQAIQLFEQAGVPDADSAAKLAQAYLKIQNPDYPKAIANFQKLLELDKEAFSAHQPMLAQAHRNYASQLLQNGELQKTVEQLEAYQMLQPAPEPQVLADLAKAKIAIAKQQLEAKPPQLDEAIQTLQDVMALDIPAKDRPQEQLAEAYLQRADRLASTGKYESALADVNEAETLRPQQPQPKRKADLLVAWSKELKDPQAKVEKLQMAVGLLPDSATMQLLGEAYFQKGDFDLAIEQFNKAKNEATGDEQINRLNHQLGTVYARQGELAFEAKDFEQAKRKLDSAIAIAPELADELKPQLAASLNELAQVAQSQGDWLQAATFWEMAAVNALEPAKTKEFQTQAVQARLAQAEDYLQDRQLDQAAAQLDLVLQAEPQSGRGHYLLGQIHLEKKDYQQATEQFTAAIRNGYATPQVYWSRALAYEQLPDTRVQMIQDFIQAEKKLPKDAPEYERYSARAKIEIERAIQAGIVYSTDPEELLGKAQEYLGARDFSMAAKTFEGLINLRAIDDPQVQKAAAQAFFEDGKSQVEKKQFQLAAKRYKQAIEYNPDFEPLYLELGRLQLQLNQPEDAVASFREGLKRAPQHAELQKELVATLVDKIGPELLNDKQAEEAERSFTEALQFDPKNAAGLFGRAKSRLLLKKLPAALEDCAVARTADPELAEEIDKCEANIRKELGTAALANEDAETALAELKLASELDAQLAPELKDEIAQAYILQAAELETRTDWTGVITALENALSLVPESAEYKGRLKRSIQARAKEAFAAKEFEKVVADYTRLLKDFEENTEYLLRRGEAYKGLGKLTEAVADFEAAANRADDPQLRDMATSELVLIYRQQAEQASRNRDYVLAKDLFTKAYAKIPTDQGKTAVGKQLAGVLERLANEQSNLGEKAKLLLEAGKYDTSKQADYAKLAVDAYKLAADEVVRSAKTAEDYQQLTADLESALKLVPTEAAELQKLLANTNYYFGLFYQQKLKDYDSAIARYTEVINAEDFVEKTTLAKAFVARGTAHYSKRDTKKAIDDYGNALKAEPANLTALNYRAYARMGSPTNSELEKAFADYAEIANIAPQSIPLTNLRNLVSFLSVDKAEYRDGQAAVKYAKLLVQRSSELSANQRAQDLVLLACAHAEAGEFSEAVKVMDESIGLADSEQSRALRNHFAQNMKLPDPTSALRYVADPSLPAGQ